MLDGSSKLRVRETATFQPRNRPLPPAWALSEPGRAGRGKPVTHQDMKNSLEFIRFAIENEVIQFGEFTLKSGRVAPYFFNTGLFNDGRSLERLSRFYAQAILQAGIKPDMLFGLAYKGIPLVATVAATLASRHDMNLPYAFDRKEAKSHGETGSLVGAPLQGRVLIVDDVMTAGTAVHQAISIIRSRAAEPLGVVVAFDRQERGTTQGLSAVEEVKQHYAIEVITVANVQDLIRYAQSEPGYGEPVARIREYIKRFGTQSS